MILVDTSVWIDFFTNKKTPQVSCLVEAINTHQDLCINGVILTEILQGIKHPREYDEVAHLLESLIYIEMPKSVFLLSAEIYRHLKSRGITVRKTIDCIIAAAAITHNVLLLHNDKDFNPIEKYCGLNIYHPFN